MCDLSCEECILSLELGVHHVFLNGALFANPGINPKEISLWKHIGYWKGVVVYTNTWINTHI